MRRVFLGLYLLSGAAGLIYEVLWTRLLTLVMGHTVAAVSTVLAAFMGGLAVGAALGGRAAGRVTERRALQHYAFIEVAVAASALLVPVALTLAGPLLVAAYADEAGRWFGPTRLLVSLAILSVPAALMGATLPLAARWFLRRIDRAGAEAGDLYAGNTIGAAAGAGLAAFVLVPALGLQITAWLAAFLNIIAAAGAWVIAGREATVPVTATAPVEPASVRPTAFAKATARLAEAARRRKPAQAGAEPGQLPLAAAALALTGFVALTSEVVWTRVLALVIGPTSYAFGVMVTVFIAGLAGGSWAGARLVSRVRDGRFALALTIVAFAAASAAALWRLADLPVEVAQSIAASGAAFGSVLRREIVVAASVLLPVAVTLGAAFPLAVRVAAREREAVARDLAILYACNTAGAIAGSLTAGFVLIEWLGLRGTLVSTAVLACAGGLAFGVAGHLSQRRVLVLGAAAIVTAWASWAAPGWDRALLSGGAYKYASYLRVPDTESALAAGTLEYYREGAAATVTVRRAAGDLMLAIDGKIDASNAGDMLTQKLLAHLPLLLHPNPRRVAIIGLGSGVTLGAALRHPIDRADVIEISPEVFEASAFFAAENHRALSDSRARSIVGDGRTHLLLGTEPYDVIISEPSNPWVAGVAALFTREFFEAARARLAPGGVLCQWAHTYDIQAADLQSIAATFASVFPRGTLWLVGAGDLLLIGSERALDADLGELAARFGRAGVAADLGEVAVADAGSLLSLYVGGPAELERYSAGALVQTDDRMALEFSAPLSLYQSGGADNARTLTALASADALPSPVRDALRLERADAWQNRGRMHLEAEAHDRAYEAFAHALRIAPDDPAAADGLVRAAEAAGRTEVDRALVLLGDIAARDRKNVSVAVAISQLLAATGAVREAIDAVSSLIETTSTDARAAEQLASLFADLGDRDRLAPVVDRLQRSWPARATTGYYAATLRLISGQVAEAIAVAEEAARRHPSDARIHEVLGVAYASVGRRDEARRAFETSLALNARNPGTHTNLGLLELEAGQPERAVARFAEALLLDPDDTNALRSLADALDALGRTDRAARIRSVRR